MSSPVVWSWRSPIVGLTALNAVLLLICLYMQFFVVRMSLSIFSPFLEVLGGAIACAAPWIIVTARDQIRFTGPISSPHSSSGYVPLVVGYASGVLVTIFFCALLYWWISLPEFSTPIR